MSQNQCFGPYAMKSTCPSCNSEVTTDTRSVPGFSTWFLSIISAHFLCCCLPFYSDACQDVVHSCPNCKTIIGFFKRL